MTAPAGVQFVPDAALGDDRDSVSARTLERIAHLAALATHASAARISVVSERQHVPIAIHVGDSRAAFGEAAATSAWRGAIDLDASYAASGLDDTDALAIEDTHEHPLTRDAQLDGDDRVRSYAAARLKTPAGVVLGTVSVIDYEPREWSPTERAALVECAALAGAELASHLSVVGAQRSRGDTERTDGDAAIASRAKSHFLTALSRELHTQLHTLRDYAELLEAEMRSSTPTERRDALRHVQLGQRHLASIIDEVLNYTSLEQGAVELKLTSVGVHDALIEAEAVLAPQVRAKAIILSLGAIRDDIAVLADVEKMREMLTKLLSNAVKFTGAGGRIDVSCETTRTDVRIRIRDTGVGIPAEKLAVIFEPFVQLRDETERTVEHAGLGLAISRALARTHGGDLGVESTVGSGSTFTLTLPRAKKTL
jgi:signal transduction histidine kinase